MATKTLQIVIAADSKGVRKATLEAGRDFDRLGKSGSKTLAHLKTGMLAVSAAAATGLVVGLKASAQAAIDSEVSMAKLKVMVENAGFSFEKHEKQIQRVIDKHSQLSGFDDEELGESFGNLLRTTGDINEAFKLNALAADVARTKGIELAGAQSLLARVYNGAFNGVKRLGVAVEPVTAAQDKLKNSTGEVTTEQVKAAKQADALATRQQVLADLQQKFGGQAKAYGETTAGAQDRARVAFENLGETIGARVTPIIARVAEGFNTLIRQITLGQGPGGRIRAVFERIAGEAVNLAGAIRSVVQWFQRHRTATTVLMSVVAGLTAAFVAYKIATIAAAVATKTAAAAVTLLNIAMRANPIGLVVTALIALGAGLVVAYKRSETFRRIVNGAWDAVKTGALAYARVVRSVIVPAFNAIKAVADKVAGAVRAVADAFRAAKNWVGGAADWIIPGGKGDGWGLPNVFPQFGGGLMGARPELGPIAGMAQRFGLGVSSGLRPGAVTSTGRQSWHATGEAIDVSGPSSGMMGFARFMANTMGPRLAELIYTPLGAWSHGQRYTPTGKIAAQHYDHVHVAMDVGAPGQGDGIGQAVRAARSVGLTGDRLATMVAIAGAESGYVANINAAGPEDSRGFWQINVGPGANPDMLRLGNLYDPMVNAKAMKIILGRQGLNAWSVYSSGKYRSWLGRARAAIAGGGGTGGLRAPGGGGGGRSGIVPLGGTEPRIEAPTGPGGPLGMEGELARVGVRAARAQASDNLAKLIAARKAERRIRQRRLATVTKALRGRMRRARRVRLLNEQAELVEMIDALTESIAEYEADRAGGATTITGAEALEAGVDTSADTGGGGVGADTGGGTADSGMAAAIDALRQEMERTRRFNEWLVNTQGPTLLAAVIASMNGGIGQRVGLGLQGIRSPVGSVAGL